jgi:hypothetical protein
LKYRLMTQFTSFVAVEEMVVTDGGKPRRVDVPVEMPHGVSYEGVFGGREGDQIIMTAMAPRQMRAAVGNTGFVGGAVASQPLSPPPPPQVAPAAVRRSASAEAMGMGVDLGREAKIDPTLLGRTGKVLVQVWLVDASDAAVAKLKALGFELTARRATMKMVIGRIDAGRLKALSELAAVKYVAAGPVMK